MHRLAAAARGCRRLDADRAVLRDEAANALDRIVEVVAKALEIERIKAAPRG